ncbi:hypothetical protein HHL17_20670 [Chitinophaga sp. G-6-1-13]|uniref:HNH endonuclease n=1 Tax=Chitinophaga fulva TaxID=2728842 RepID=A0A848GMI6_9BACT|nr:hypothetical protein [Chitinophaga fulva]NML39626.1 hypothetical protein [Chitinophaga fulva]
MSFISYQGLLKKLGDAKPSYKELLLTVEWRAFRERIIDRDNITCQKCKIKAYPSSGTDRYYTKMDPNEYEQLLKERTEEIKKNPFIDLLPEMEGGFHIKNNLPYPANEIDVEIHVHHTYYVLNNLPWEYDTGSLITVCSDCHKAIHKNEIIYVYRDKQLSSSVKLISCTKCEGTGYLPAYDYFENGICFACGGSGSLNLEING